MTCCRDCGSPLRQTGKGFRRLCDECWWRHRPKGERCGRAKLSEAEARAIRFASPSETHADIARAYGIDASQVLRIRRAQSWRHL